MKYKDMTYTIRSDKRLMKRITINKKSISLYANSVKELYDKYIEARNGKIRHFFKKEYNFMSYAETWLKINSGGKEMATIKEYEYILKKYLIPYFGKKRLSEIKKIDIQVLQSDLLKGNHTVLAHKCIRIMKSILNEAIDNDILEKNPCNGIKEPKIIHKEKEILTEVQDKALLECQNKHAPFFRIIRYTGMRKEEISALTKNDIDLKNMTISVNKAFSYATNQPTLKSTKNKKSRIIPIPQIIDKDVVNVYNNASVYLFEKQNGGVLTNESIRCMTRSICSSLGFKISPHQLRHCYCTMLYYSGISIKQTQKLMGHSSAQMVYDLYAHLDEQKEHAIDKINDWVSNRVSN